ncbi:MAG: hypothetical protein AAF269_16655 [Pseudomonadota bacterium]
MREYSFKPAPVRKTQTWAIKDDHLMRRGGANALNLADVTGASWNTVTYRGTRSAWLHLTSETGVTKIEYTDTGGAREEFFALIIAVAQGLERVNPGLQIKHGYSAPWRTALFILGIAGSLLGIFLVYVGLTNMTGKGGVQATIAGAVMVLLLVPVAWSCRPNLKAQTYGTDGLVREIVSLGGASMDQPEQGAGPG